MAGLVLQQLEGLVVIDEVQRQPGLFPLLRVLADREPRPARFLLLGSASPDLVRGLSESLAGRVAYIHLRGFAADEVSDLDALWTRGGYPDSFLAPTEAASFAWRTHFVASFLERDIPALGIRVAPATLRRFWTMVAHYHGQTWNATDFARALGVRPAAARHYLDILTGAYIVRQLPPWFENVGKRLVKAPKPYVIDTGLLHNLLRLEDRLQVQSHPKLGVSWEGFAIEQVITLADAERDAYYYKTHGGAELDLLLLRHGKRYGFEFKYADAPRTTRSMHTVMADLKLERLWVVHPGVESFPLHEGIDALAIGHLRQTLTEHGLMQVAQGEDLQEEIGLVGGAAGTGEMLPAGAGTPLSLGTCQRRLHRP